ncbi:hypothetical protein NA57DRAFT_76347 [Rhizodiscina lignyota]|uniref:Uncharacterized protein n=1 Tax=Rhizodiscina lignyota TaxID=1504668 RepID=A0A9P4MAW1_9PEZI|nr:hypothetical protein NA57DRAFT_76347 [Rhizodiscina lignyota]
MKLFVFICGVLAIVASAYAAPVPVENCGRSAYPDSEPVCGGIPTVMSAIIDFAQLLHVLDTAGGKAKE